MQTMIDGDLDPDIAAAASGSPAISEVRVAELTDDPGLVLTALAYWRHCCTEADKNRKRIGNPTGLLVAFLCRPGTYGMVRAAGGDWLMPAEARRAQEEAARERQRQESMRERERQAAAELAEGRRRLACESARYDLEEGLWQSLEARERQAIEHEAKAGGELFFQGRATPATYENSTFLRRLCLDEMYRRHPELKEGTP